MISDNCGYSNLGTTMSVGSIDWPININVSNLFRDTEHNLLVVTHSLQAKEFDVFPFEHLKENYIIIDKIISTRTPIISLYNFINSIFSF